jgi:hypothetical protein
MLEPETGREIWRTERTERFDWRVDDFTLYF